MRYYGQQESKRTPQGVQEKRICRCRLDAENVQEDLREGQTRDHWKEEGGSGCSGESYLQNTPASVHNEGQTTRGNADEVQSNMREKQPRDHSP